MSVEEFSGIGFAPGVVRGVRSFDIDKLGRLTGVVHRQVWRPGENSAECRKEEGVGGWGTSSLMRSINQVSYYYSAVGSPPPPPSYTSLGGALFPSSSKAERRNRKTASDQPEPVPTEPVPEPVHEYDKCTCGFYGYYDGSNDYRDEDRVNGVVEGYGETVIGTRGFRAMKARIVALHIPDSVRDQYVSFVARNYKDIPFFSSFKDMVAEFPPDGGELAVAPETDPDFWTRSI